MHSWDDLDFAHGSVDVEIDVAADDDTDDDLDLIDEQIVGPVVLYYRRVVGLVEKSLLFVVLEKKKQRNKKGKERKDIDNIHSNIHSSIALPRKFLKFPKSIVIHLSIEITSRKLRTFFCKRTSSLKLIQV